MAATLIKPTDPIDVKQLVCLFYGQPGSRKSSLCQTANDPFTLAFDRGIYRAFGRKACAIFDQWADVASLSTDQSDSELVRCFRDSKTVITDTQGMCMELLSQAIIAESPKNGNRMGGLSLQGYGVLANQFAQWIAGLRAGGKDLVMVCHEESEKTNDGEYHRPAIVGKSYNVTMQNADIVGYLHFWNGKRVIDFSPTDQWMAKTPPCGWGQIPLPDFQSEPQFLAKLLAEAKASMGRISAESAELAKIVDHWQAWLSQKPMLETFNAGLADLSGLSNGAKKQAWHLVQEYAGKQGWTFDKNAKVFVAPKEAA